MGQNRKIRKSRNKNKLKVENRDFLDLSVSAPLEKIEPIIPRFPNYDFKIELERDAKKRETAFVVRNNCVTWHYSLCHFAKLSTFIILIINVNNTANKLFLRFFIS